jgi:pyruvate,water dikinase
VGASLVERLVVPKATAAERLDFAERTLERGLRPDAPARHAGSGRRPGDARCRRLAARQGCGRRRSADGAAGLPHNITTKMDLALWDLGGRIREDRDARAVA